ncbi:hypothetical protein BS78_03G415100 [Paspalum vaginatum]|nr:hypothetical protein BS78_03G415100 [Paspalum vaginatum]
MRRRWAGPRSFPLLAFSLLIAAARASWWCSELRRPLPVVAGVDSTFVDVEVAVLVAVPVNSPPITPVAFLSLGFRHSSFLVSSTLVIVNIVFSDRQRPVDLLVRAPHRVALRCLNFGFTSTS